MNLISDKDLNFLKKYRFDDIYYIENFKIYPDNLKFIDYLIWNMRFVWLFRRNFRMALRFHIFFNKN